MELRPQNNLDRTFILSKYRYDETYSYSLSAQQDWVNELIEELEVTTEEKDKSGSINLDLEFKVVDRKPYGETLLAKCHIAGEYTTPCVRCLVPTTKSVKIEISAAFVNQRFETDPDWEEVDIIYLEDQEWTIHFHEKGNVDFFEMIHETIFLNIDPLPLHHDECKGLCPQCGSDLNHESCPHNKS